MNSVRESERESERERVRERERESDCSIVAFDLMIGLVYIDVFASGRLIAQAHRHVWKFWTVGV